jgi:Tol biopolymer transport system component
MNTLLTFRRIAHVRSWLSACAGLSMTFAAQAASLQVERIDLDDAAPDVQAYNLQETRDLRVFARSEAGFKRSRVFVQRREGGQWGPAEAWAHTDARWRASDPHLSADGQVLTFVSDRAEQGDAPLGQLDLFESRFDGGRWTAPKRLAASLQSPGYELGPERHGDWLYFASYRSGGPGKLSVYRARGGQGDSPQALPSPVNDEGMNSDFTLTPDGRYALWWSSRGSADGRGGDLFLSERVGASFGPALRLPEPVNSPGFEFTPSVSADGQWLYFASTREGPAGLSHMYRVWWPALLAAMGPQLEAFSQAQLDERVTALWRAISHAPGQSLSGQQLADLLHPLARIHGQVVKDGQLALRSWTGSEFLTAVNVPSAQGLFECEVTREQRRYGPHAQVYSVVQTHRDAARSKAEYTGVNSMQWQLGPDGWQLLSLHYALELPGQAPPATASTTCLG